MRLPRRRTTSTADPMLPMINVVFLLLVFFLIAAALATPDPVEITPPAARDGDPAGSDAALLLGPGGEVVFRDLAGDAAIAAALAEGVTTVRADAAAEARSLAALLGRLRAGGVEGLRLVTLPAP